MCTVYVWSVCFLWNSAELSAEFCSHAGLFMTFKASDAKHICKGDLYNGDDNTEHVLWDFTQLSQLTLINTAVFAVNHMPCIWKEGVCFTLLLLHWCCMDGKESTTQPIRALWWLSGRGPLHYVRGVSEMQKREGAGQKPGDSWPPPPQRER